MYLAIFILFTGQDANRDPRPRCSYDSRRVNWKQFASSSFTPKRTNQNVFHSQNRISTVVLLRRHFHSNSWNFLPRLQDRSRIHDHRDKDSQIVSPRCKTTTHPQKQLTAWGMRNFASESSVSSSIHGAISTFERYDCTLSS